MNPSYRSQQYNMHASRSRPTFFPGKMAYPNSSYATGYPYSNIMENKGSKQNISDKYGDEQDADPRHFES